MHIAIFRHCSTLENEEKFMFSNDIRSKFKIHLPADKKFLPTTEGKIKGKVVAVIN
jgi:hypothetical protein